MEHKSTRKDRIKNVTILFLSVMLVLTLFSNTIMNRNLVQVSTQAVTEEELTTKVRGNGTATAQETYEVSIDKKRKILTMDVRTGQEVKTGDLLFTLEEVDSEEVAQKKEALDSARRTYESAVLTSGVTVDERKAIESASIGSLTNRQNNLSDLQDKYDIAKDVYDGLTEQLTNINDQIKDSTGYDMTQTSLSHSVDVLNRQKTALLAADKNADVSAIDSQIRDIQAQKEDITYWYTMQGYSETHIINVDTSALKSAIAAAKKDMDNAKKELDRLIALQGSQLSLMANYQDLLKAQEEYEKAKGSAQGDTDVKAKISGTIIEINYTAGNSVAANQTIMTIQPENKMATLSFSVTAKQAARIKPGDPAEILNNWSGDDVTARVASVKRDAMGGDKYTVVCEMGGNGVVIGNSYTLSIGSQSARYELVVPSSTIKTDNNGSFVLTITSKSTPLGNRYYANRVPVEVLTSDDTKSAVVGSLTTADYVITTTTKPVASGDQVRLSD